MTAIFVRDTRQKPPFLGRIWAWLRWGWRRKWSPFDESGQLRDLSKEGWVNVGALRVAPA